MVWRLRLRIFGSRRLLLWLWFLAAVAAPPMIDLLQGTYALAQSRYMLAGLPAAYLLAAIGLGCLGRPIRVVVLLADFVCLGFGDSKHLSQRLTQLATDSGGCTGSQFEWQRA